MSEAIKRILQRVEIRVFVNSPEAIGRFLGNEKYKIPIINSRDAVYKIRCGCGICYISQTARSLEHWIYEYRKCSENQIRSTKDEHTLEEKSAIVLHAIKFGHTFSFDNAQPVITNVRNLYNRVVVEQLTIKATEKKNCNKKDASPLSKAWIPLIPRLSFHFFSC